MHKFFLVVLLFSLSIIVCPAHVIATQETEPNGLAGDPLCYNIQPAENCPADLVDDNWVSGNVTASDSGDPHDKQDNFYFSTNFEHKITFNVNQCDLSTINDCTQFYYEFYGSGFTEILTDRLEDLGSTFTYIDPGKWDLVVEGSSIPLSGCSSTADYNISWILEPLANDSNEVEDNDTLANACPALASNIGVLGCWRPSASTYTDDRDKEDYYKFTALTKGINVKIYTDVHLFGRFPDKCWVAIKNGAGNEIVRGTFTQNIVENITTSELIKEDLYYIHVHNEINTAGRYEFEIEFFAVDDCPDCSGPNVVIKDFTIQDGSNCNCTAQNVTIGPNFILKSGAEFTVDADTLNIVPSAQFENGSVFNTSP